MNCNNGNNCNNNCNNDNSHSKCVPYEEFIKVSELARAYVPFQKLCSIFDQEEGLIKGTIFPELVSPYCKGDSNMIREDNPCNRCNPCENRPMPFPLFR